jgi:outer membrane lipoprotein-sorting protein
MKKLMVILLSLISMGVLVAQDMKLDEILEKYSKAIGQDKWARIQTIKTTGKMTQSGMEFQLSSIEKRPEFDRTEMDIQGTKIIMVFDGQTGWMINPTSGSFDPQDMSPDMVTSTFKENRKDPYNGWNNPLINWKANGNKLELIGKEDMSGTPVYNLKMTFKDDAVVNFYLDITKFVVLAINEKSVIQGQSYEIESRFSDFREVDGIINPFKFDNYVNGALNISAAIDRVEYNLPCDDAIFKKPAVEKK